MRHRSLESEVLDLTLAIGLLVRRVRAASSAHGLSMTETSVMSRLMREGPATTAELARAEAMKPQSMGTTVAALEEMGFVERKAHPTDGRQIRIAPTDKGAAMQQSVKDARRSWLAEAITHLDKDEQATLFAAGKIMKRLAAL